MVRCYGEADPANFMPFLIEGQERPVGKYAFPIGPTTMANDGIFGTNLRGLVVAMDMYNGTILWKFDTQVGLASGPTISQGKGYNYRLDNNIVYAFGLDNINITVSVGVNVTVGNLKLLLMLLG